MRAPATFSLAVSLLALAPSAAFAQSVTGLLNGGTRLGPDTLQGAAPYGNPIRDDRVYAHAFLDQFEGRLGSESYFRYDGQAWIGDDYNKLWLKSEGRYNADNRGRFSDGDHEALYARPISTYFDMQVGVRSDIDSLRNRTWAAFGIQGLAIGFWNLELTGYASDNGRFAFRGNASYDLYLTQRLILQPQIEMNAYSKADRGRELGSGVSDIDMGLRLRYEFTREIAPYVGLSYQQFLGGTADYRRRSGEGSGDLRALAGLRLWY
ncbi:copper resistance protein CopB [Methylobacterium radiotolerans]|uniref:copper resistance protein B n=1 Tax=Methylobacterium TaxID=407 RepID=UPI0005BA65C7|nr:MULTISPECIES: copper resistance protein B [unclassified Methylobacterium]KIU37247.1 copper resistance protein CopB [Methylobacterium radiotolerans]RUP22640.1 MAG: copper resistance protein B [Methylobacterium sp.]